MRELADIDRRESAAPGRRRLKQRKENTSCHDFPEKAKRASMANMPIAPPITKRKKVTDVNLVNRLKENLRSLLSRKSFTSMRTGKPIAPRMISIITIN